MKYLNTFLILTGTILISTQVFAHVNHVHSNLASGFINGLAHPFSGADHIITLLLAGVLIARFAAGQTKIAISTLSLLTVAYLWLHGTEITMMNSEFVMGFIASSLSISGLAFLMDKYFISKLNKRHA